MAKKRKMRVWLEILVIVFLLGCGLVGYYFLGNYDYHQGYSNGNRDGNHTGYHAGYLSGQKDGYQSGYKQGYTKGQSDGYATGQSDGQGSGYVAGETQGQIDELQTIADWISGIGCSQTTSGYVYFKMWKDSIGTWHYTCLVNSY